MELRFIPVTAADRGTALSLHVAPDQTGTVETAAECLAEADGLPLWRPVIVEADGRPVGFAMYGLWRDEGTAGRVWLDRFFIDEHCQGRGCAKAALPPLIAAIRAEYGRDELFLSVYADNAPAIALYEGLGFRFNGETDVHGERVMVLRLP